MSKLSKQNFITTIRIALPLAVAAVATMGLEVVDTVMMGWLGREQLAGGAIVNAIYLFLAATMAGMMTSVGVSVANAIGAEEKSRVKIIVDQGIIFVALMSIPIVTLLWFAADVARFFGQPENVLVHVQAYARYHSIQATALRYFCVYGPKQDYRRTIPPVMSAFIIKLLKNERPVIYGTGNKKRDFVVEIPFHYILLICPIQPIV